MKLALIATVAFLAAALPAGARTYRDFGPCTVTREHRLKCLVEPGRYRLLRPPVVCAWLGGANGTPFHLYCYKP